MPKVTDNTPACIKPYIFHGVDLTVNDTQAIGDCPFCGKERKFYVGLEDKDDGKDSRHFAGGWKCMVCGLSGNVYTFFKHLYEVSTPIPNNEDIELAVDRELLGPKQIQQWGLHLSPLTGDWMVPGYNIEGTLTQLYSYREDRKGHKRLVCTTGTSHALMGVSLYQPRKAVVYICESLWDAMAVREVLAQTKREGLVLTNGDIPSQPALSVTGNEGVSLLSESNVLAVPGCNVFDDKWITLLEDKIVYLMFHSDHPSKAGTCAGHEGMKRVAKLLSEARHTPAQIHYIHWGPEEGDGSHDPDQKSGYDLRDILIKSGNKIAQRIGGLSRILSMCKPVPAEWMAQGTITGEGKIRIAPLPCDSYSILMESMRAALRVRQSMEDTFSVALAVTISTEQTGNQLFLQIIAAPGSGKTDMADGMLMSEHCYPLEHLTGFISGVRSNDGSFSLLDRCDGKTLITPEGDLMLKNPKFDEIMAQLRRIFDGTMVASYRNRKEDLNWTGLRTPWIINGTPEILNIDQSRLGDRFVRIIIDPPATKQEKDDILESVCETAWDSCAVNRNEDAKAQSDNDDPEAQGIPKSNLTPKMLKFRRLIAGYINHLMVDHTAVLKTVRGDNKQWVFDVCKTLADFTAIMRARPDTDYKKHRTTEVSAELPTRLTHQFVRLARCLAAVLNKELVDEEVMRRVTKVAMDTSRGTTLDIVRVLYDSKTSMHFVDIVHYTHHTRPEEELLLSFLRRLSVVQIMVPVGQDPQHKNFRSWRLHPEFRALYEKVTGIKQEDE